MFRHPRLRPVTVLETNLLTSIVYATTTCPKTMLQLYVWPGAWNLPSIDSQCLIAILYLQLSFPGRFKIVECANPDVSPLGEQLSEPLISR